MVISALVVLLFVDIQAINALGISTPYVRVGCYGDVSRPLPDLLGNYYYSATWNTIGNIIKNCSELAQSQGYRYFGLQHYGECWSGKDADLTYARDGSSDACVKGVGKKGANFVYKFLNTLDHSCDQGWYSAKENCFKISSNATITSPVEATEYCSKYHGAFHLTKTTNDILTQDRLLRTLTLNKQLNETNCLVLSEISVPYTGVMSPWNDTMPRLVIGLLSGGSHGYRCAVKDIHGTWYTHGCSLNVCDVLCSTHRVLQPKDGAFTLVRRNAMLVNNLLRWQLVDGVIECARECLVTDACHSFNLEYNSLSQVVGSLCGLNQNKFTNNSLGELEESVQYQYFERL